MITSNKTSTRKSPNFMFITCFMPNNSLRFLTGIFINASECKGSRYGTILGWWLGCVFSSLVEPQPSFYSPTSSPQPTSLNPTCISPYSSSFPLSPFPSDTLSASKTTASLLFTSASSFSTLIVFFVTIAFAAPSSSESVNAQGSEAFCNGRFRDKTHCYRRFG